MPDDASRTERSAEILDIQVCGLRQRLHHLGASKAIIGISGGLDSTLALLVTAYTFDILGLDRKGIVSVTMPGFGTSGRTYQNANKLMKALGVTCLDIEIKEACLRHFSDIGHDAMQHDLTFENAQARERMQILMDLGNKYNAPVIGTGDLSELALGWTTYNGDHMSMYAVNSGVPKTTVQLLVKHIAETSSMGKEITEILLDVLDTPISPELLPSESDEIEQCTEQSVGPYELHDFFIYHFLYNEFSPEKIFFLAQVAFEGKYSKKEIKSVMRIFFKRFFAQQYKRNCLPDGPKVGCISLSPRGEWHMPSDAVGSMWLAEVDRLPEV